VAELLLNNAIVIAALLGSVWLVSLPLRDVSIIDIAWGLGFVLVAWASTLSSTANGAGAGLLLWLTTLWGLRLSGYLAWRNHGRPEDPRYARMRNKWGRWFPLVSLLSVFALQGAIMWVVSLPVQLGIAHPENGWSPLHAVGTFVWAVGLFFETVGDWQLARFKSDRANAGRVLDEGLWRYTRHPNYFGDFCVWWGLFLVAVGSGAPLWTIVGPVVMSVLLMYVSGVTLLEKDLTSRKPAYADYIRRTNAFFPWFPRRSKT
jgi:steroid 5-alpha reductase family enzyme